MFFFKKMDIFSHKNVNKTMSPFSYFFKLNTNKNTNPCLVDINIEKVIQDIDTDNNNNNDTDKDSDKEKELSNFHYPREIFNIYDTENYFTLAFITFMGLGFGIGFGFRCYLKKR